MQGLNKNTPGERYLSQKREHLEKKLEWLSHEDWAVPQDIDQLQREIRQIKERLQGRESSLGH